MLLRPTARVPSRRRTSAARALRRVIAPLLALAAGAVVAFPIPAPDDPLLQEVVWDDALLQEVAPEDALLRDDALLQGPARADALLQEVAPNVLLQDAAPGAVTTQGGGVSLEQAIQLALQRYPGRVVRTETTSRNGRRVHEIRIYVEGDGEPRMRIVRIDAENGRFL